MAFSEVMENTDVAGGESNYEEVGEDIREAGGTHQEKMGCIDTVNGFPSCFIQVHFFRGVRHFC